MKKEALRKILKGERQKDCPSEELVAKYLAGKLFGEDREVFERHLAECDLCLGAVVAAREAMAEFHLDMGEEVGGVNRCTKCGAAVLEGASFCRECGASLAAMVACFNCKQAIPSDSKFCPYCGAELRPHHPPHRTGFKKLGKHIWENRWLVGAVILFALSFIVRKYFWQLTVAAGIAGVKWALDSSYARTLIMIYNSWRKGEEEEFEKFVERIKKRAK